MNKQEFISFLRGKGYNYAADYVERYGNDYHNQASGDYDLSSAFSWKNASRGHLFWASIHGRITRNPFWIRSWLTANRMEYRTY